jgi:DnaK suppressor protein
MVSKAKAPARRKSPAKKPAKSAKPQPAKTKAAPKRPVRAPAKAAPKAVKPAAKSKAVKPSKAAAPVAAKGKPAAKPALPAKSAVAAKSAAPATRIAGSKAANPKGRPSVAVVPAPSPNLVAPVPKTAARPVHSVSPKDLAAAHEYLLSRSSSRSEEPVIVNGRRLPTEEQLLGMTDDQYMNEDQLAFFKFRLQQMERELLSNAGETTEHLRETVIVPDPADRATIEEEHALELRTRDRERKLLKKIQSSLQSIETGEYGFCEETGDPIGIPRLLARPTATLSLEAQQRREMKQKLFGD